MDKLALFEEKEIRRKWKDNDWYFSVIDVIYALTDSVDANAYWRKLKQRLIQEGNESVTFCHSLKMTAKDGKDDRIISYKINIFV